MKLYVANEKNDITDNQTIHTRNSPFINIFQIIKKNCKRGKGFEQTFHQRGYKFGKYAHEMMFKIISH